MDLLNKEVDCVFRITTENDFKDYEYLVKGYKSLVVREKEGVSQHYHGYVEKIKKNTLDTRLKKCFKGNKQYSCKVVKDTILQKRYLCKGDSETIAPVVIINTLEVDIVKENKEFWLDRSIYLEKKKESGTKAKSFIDRVFQRLQEVPQTPQLYSIRSIINTIINMCVEEGKLIPGDYLMISYIETIQARSGCDMELKTRRIIDKMAVHMN